MKTQNSSTTDPAKAAMRQMAAIDVGTSAIRMDIAEVFPDGNIRIIDSLQQPVELGKDTFSTGKIAFNTIEQCVDILCSYRRILNEHGIVGANCIRAVATSAIMEAENSDVFVDRVYIASGINIEPIDDMEVNRLAFLSLYQLFAKAPELKKGNVLVAEVGGGNTKLLLLHNGTVQCAEVFRLGAVRIRENIEKHFASSDQLPAMAIQYIKKTVSEMAQVIRAKNIQSLVAVAGDMCQTFDKLVPGTEHSKTRKFPLPAFAALKKICLAPQEELVKRYHLSYHEAETIPPALLAYIEMAKVFKAKNIFISDMNLRQGVLLGAAGGGIWNTTFLKQIMQSALQMGEKYDFDRAHALHVAKLAKELFAALQSEHRLDKHFGVLLEVAAILHDIGKFINPRSHHKHSAYLIQNGELFGLSKEDIKLIALIARYHRRSAPKPAHTDFMALERDNRLAIVKLAALLRIADALDQSKIQAVRKIRLAQESRQLVIFTPETCDLALERLGLEEKADMFESIYGKKVVLMPSTPPIAGETS